MTEGLGAGRIFLTTKVPCCPGTGFCKQPEYAGTIAQDIAKNNALLGTVTPPTLVKKSRRDLTLSRASLGASPNPNPTPPALASQRRATRT